MSQSNRQRRAAKATARRRARQAAQSPRGGAAAGRWPYPGDPGLFAGREDWFPDGGFSGEGCSDAWFDEGYLESEPMVTTPRGRRVVPTAGQIETWIDAVVAGLRSPSPRGRSEVSSMLDILVTETGEVRAVVDSALHRLLLGALHQAWGRGWQPRDLHRVTAADAALATLLGDLMLLDLARYAQATVHPAFREQLAALGLRRWWPSELSLLQARTELQHQEWGMVVSAAIDLLGLLRSLAELPLVCPPPGRLAPEAADTTEVSEKILERVRQLLAKAESTSFEAEADTFTAGAQALMARHRIDTAMLAAGAARHSGPQTARIYVDAPYEDPKCSLLSVISSANGCRTVWHKELGFVSLVGFGTDLLAVETLFTSLLVQATTAMRRHGSQQDRAGRSRTRAFRSSFLLSYAHRIGERLDRVVAEEVQKASAETAAGDLLPVLASRTAEVEATFTDLFPHVRLGRSRSASDARGWQAGRVAADQAALQYGSTLAAGATG